jgi:hypothetical protein
MKQQKFSFFEASGRHVERIKEKMEKFVRAEYIQFLENK